MTFKFQGEKWILKLRQKEDSSQHNVVISVNTKSLYFIQMGAEYVIAAKELLSGMKWKGVEKNIFPPNLHLLTTPHKCHMIRYDVESWIVFLKQLEQAGIDIPKWAWDNPIRFIKMRMGESEEIEINET